MALAAKTVASPVGPLRLVGSARGLVAVLWKDDRAGRVRLDDVVEDPADPILCRTETQLTDYFAGRRSAFDIALDLRGTPFQARAWRALRAIPFGKTRTYGALAREVGNARAARAVGAACGRNPVSIIVPCHRAIGSSGALTGFAGGLETKRFLLDLEARIAD